MSQQVANTITLAILKASVPVGTQQQSATYGMTKPDQKEMK